MSRLFTRTLRLLRLGAVAGVAIGVGRMVLRRRRNTGTGESSWPTIAETAAQDGDSTSGTANSSEAADSEMADGGAADIADDTGEAATDEADDADGTSKAAADEADDTDNDAAADEAEKST